MTIIGYGTSAASISAAGTTEICPGPAVGVTRALNGIFVFNDDTVLHTVSVVYLDPDLNAVKIVSDAILHPKESVRVEEPPMIPMANNGQLNVIVNEPIATNSLSTSVIYTDVTL